MPLPAGTLIEGRYRVEKMLAIGGFAVVYLATDMRLSRQVAVKDMICPDPAEFNVRLSFFQREAQILKALAGAAAVPRVYDFAHQGKLVRLVLEYFQGQDLLKIMEGNGNHGFAFDLVVEWSKSLCDVLNQMHSFSPPLVHRDVKPENIMLLEDQRTIKMIDFGTARGVGRTNKTRLASKTRVFTEGYAPPEQILGKAEIRSDLFALAGTMYHLLTGKTPEGFYTARELEAQLASGNGTISNEQRWLYEIIKINLAEDANDRYYSCQELRADLERRAVTRTVLCQSCRAQTPVRRPYCTHCGHPQTAPLPPCGQCNRSNRLGSKFCIYCGHRLTW